MALSECPDCGRLVSDQADSCPSCGYPFHTIDTKERDVAGHGVPALFSFFVPGLGQLIKGDYLGAVAPYVLAYLAIQIFNNLFHKFLALVAIWVLQLVDTYRIKRKTN